MKSILVIFLIFCTGLMYSQDQGIRIPDSLGGFFIYKVPDKHRIIKELKEFEKYSVEELNTRSKLTYHLAVSSCRLYLGMDSSLYHFKEAYKINPKIVCGKMLARHNYFIKALEKSKESGVEDAYIKTIKRETGNVFFSWYLWDLPDFDEFAFVDSCNQKFPPIEPTPIFRTGLTKFEG